MRLNKFVALATGMSRRKADQLIASGHIMVNNQPAMLGQTVNKTDVVTHNGATLKLKEITTIMLNKPVGYVCSRDGQGSRTIYDLLPTKFHSLKPVGRLDKDSSGLLLLTNDGDLANKLTHPSHQKNKVYQVQLNTPLSPEHKASLEKGIELDDGQSILQLKGKNKNWQVSIHEGRNRQIRRTFSALGYTVDKLHRDIFGEYKLHLLAEGSFKII